MISWLLDKSLTNWQGTDQHLASLRPEGLALGTSVANLINVLLTIVNYVIACITLAERIAAGIWR